MKKFNLFFKVNKENIKELESEKRSLISELAEYRLKLEQEAKVFK
jgi:hypothetical protein